MYKPIRQLYIGLENTWNLNDPLPDKLIKDVDYFSGVTIIGDGRSILLINPRSFIK